MLTFTIQSLAMQITSLSSFRLLLPIAALTAILYACSGDNARPVTKAPVRATLTEADLFSGDVIRQFLTRENPFVKEAGNLFMQALDLYKNKQDAPGAIPLFIQSILKNPESRSYYELGNACLDARDYDRAGKCYEMAEKLGYEPLSKVMYNLACVYALKKKPELAGQYLQYSLQAGYSNLDHMAVDKDLANLRRTYYYQQAISQGTKGMSNAKVLFWLQFKKPFAKVKLPYTINGEKKQFGEGDYIPYDFDKYIVEMRDERFSREVSKSFYYSAELASNERYVAFVYAVQDAFSEGVSPVLYRLVTYTNEGKLIDKCVIAGREAFDEPLKTAVVAPDLSFVIKTFELEYTKNPDEEGYEDNPVKSRRLVGTGTFQINEDGTITAAAL